jgi:hypothetical protein
VIKDGLDREIRHHRASELAQHVRELLLTSHNSPSTDMYMRPRGLGGALS